MDSKPTAEKDNAHIDSDEPTATCPICREDKGIVTKKYESWELFEHLRSKEHTKSNLASFFAYEAVFQGFWEEYNRIFTMVKE